MLASIRSKLTLALLVGTFAFAQDRSDPIVSPRETEPQVISRVEPNFLDVPARPVRLRISVNSKGLATKISVLTSQDQKSIEAAIAAVQNWRFQPGTRNGVPVDSTLVVSFPAN